MLYTRMSLYSSHFWHISFSVEAFKPAENFQKQFVPVSVATEILVWRCCSGLPWLSFLSGKIMLRNMKKKLL
jgi:hypothetical protein